MRILFMDNSTINQEILNRAIPLTNENDAFLKYAYEAHYNKYAVIIDQGVLILQPNLKNVLQTFEIHAFIMCYFMPKNHILHKYFDNTIRRIIESGFLDKIISEMKFFYSNKGYLRDQDDGISRVSLKQMEIAFFLLIFGYSIDIIVFLIELLYYYNCKDTT